MVMVNEVFSGDYIKADDLQGREVKVTISEAEMKTFNNNERKIALRFRGKERGMICNKTNANRIAFSYGPDTDNWIGKDIILYGEVVDFQGKATLGLRVRVPSGAAYQQVHGQRPQARTPEPDPFATAPASADSYGGGPDFDDSVPFAPYVE